MTELSRKCGSQGIGSFSKRDHSCPTVSPRLEGEAGRVGSRASTHTDQTTAPGCQALCELSAPPSSHNHGKSGLAGKGHPNCSLTDTLGPLLYYPPPPLKLPATASAAKSLQLCPTLCDPIDSCPPSSPIPGTLQARTLEWINCPLPHTKSEVGFLQNGKKI